MLLNGCYGFRLGLGGYHRLHHLLNDNGFALDRCRHRINRNHHGRYIFLLGSWYGFFFLGFLPWLAHILSIFLHDFLPEIIIFLPDAFAEIVKGITETVTLGICRGGHAKCDACQQEKSFHTHCIFHYCFGACITPMLYKCHRKYTEKNPMYGILIHLFFIHTTFLHK